MSMKRSLFIIAALLPTIAFAQDSNDALVKRGAYVATASDCVACHTAPGGQPMAGGLPMSSPVGTIMSTNITPSKEFGIGNYTEQQFFDAVRKGVRADGANLYPAMPYTAFSHMSDEDISALYAYFMQGVKPVDQTTKETSLPFPMNIRASMMGWNLLFRNNTPLTSDPSQSDEWNRGRYLVEGPAHCSTCHTPRGILMQETSAKMSGSQVGAWYAPNITADVNNGVGSWSKKQLVEYLKTGKVSDMNNSASGSMAEAISHSFQYLTDADLGAMATYLSTIPAISKGDTSRFGHGTAMSVVPSFRGRSLNESADALAKGGLLYSANCASCHGYEGQGMKDRYYPALFKNSATSGDNANNLLATILYGVHRKTESGDVFMPPFGDQPNAMNHLNNDDIALLANYILTSYGDKKLNVTPENVQVIRDGGPKSNMVQLARIGMGVGAFLLVAILTFITLWWRTRRSPATQV
jgi:mono/diheme cytochrome c family protein